MEMRARTRERDAFETFRGYETHVKADEATLAEVDAEPTDGSNELLNRFLIAEIARFVVVAAKDVGERVHCARSIGDEVDTSMSIQNEGSRVVTPPARAVRNGHHGREKALLPCSKPSTGR